MQIIINNENIQNAYAQLLETCHNIKKHNSSVTKGNWSKSIDFCYWDYDIIELFDKTATIIATDEIYGKSFKIATALGLTVSRAPSNCISQFDLKEITDDIIINHTFNENGGL